MIGIISTVPHLVTIGLIWVCLIIIAWIIRSTYSKNLKTIQLTTWGYGAAR